MWNKAKRKSVNKYASAVYEITTHEQKVIKKKTFQVPQITPVKSATLLTKDYTGKSKINSAKNYLQWW